MILDQFQSCSRAECIGVCQDFTFARLRIERDMAFAFKFRFVIVKAFDRIWPDPVAAMALGHIARFDAANFHINHVAIQEADNALQRTHPTETRPARFHRFRPREIIHHLR